MTKRVSHSSPWIPVVAGIAACLLFAVQAGAEGIKYIPDPVYKSFDPAEASPMQDMLDLANSGDVRAQYILGDLYAKGKGGLARDEKKGAQWFETAAKNGYFEAFIRLAALAKRQDDLSGAYKWYTLATQYMNGGPWRTHATAARDALEKEDKLTPDQRDAARKEANLWRAELRKAREEKKESERRAALEAAREKQAKKDEEPEPDKEKIGPPVPAAAKEAGLR